MIGNTQRLNLKAVNASLGGTAMLAVALLCCDTPGIRLVDPEAVSDSSTGVTFHVTLEDSALAAALGWEDGVPNALISYYRIMEGTPIQTAETDTVGILRRPELLPGQYRFVGYRLLREEEAGPTGRLVRAFGDGLVAWVQPPQVVELVLRADRRGSVVISEIRRGGRYEGPDSEWPTYDYFGYFELYNNSDTTVYLDGMLWGKAFRINNDYTPYPCTMTSQYRNYRQGIWVRYFHQFPGDGNDYSLPPGQVAVIAQDAVDHSVVHPSLPDLSGADFELEGTADADNPGVPNLRDVGPRKSQNLHGLDMDCSNGCFLAQATDVDLLVKERLPFFDGTDWNLIPMASILDVVTTDVWSPSMDQWTPCATKVHRDLDRLEKPEIDLLFDVSIALQRKVLRTVPNGIPLLHDVGVSFCDFEVSPRSPGWHEY